VNNAGIERHGSLLEMPDEEFDRMIAVNLRGVFNGIKHGGAAMVTSGGGAIVNVASLAALGGMPLFGAYRAAKAGVVQLTRTAALELRDAKVRVNAILPGFIRTPLAQDRATLFSDLMGANLANAVLHLCSDEASFITGASYVADAGVSVGVV
jgi:NAD(P)-dependent dehydrogenase (short-subunit alcohol dehydrogenase family)